MIKLFIDSTECKDFDWQNFSINIRRDRENRIINITMPQTNTFRGDAYAIIRDAFIRDGWCATLPVTIQKACDSGYENIIEGLIFLNDCEFRTQRCEVDVPIRDNSYYAKIYNNEAIEIQPDSDESKNGASITKCTPIDLDLFKPSTGAYNSGFAHAGTRKAYDLFDVLKHQIAFITDGEVTLSSSWYSGLDTDKRIAIIRGYELRNGDASKSIPAISHRETFKDIARLFNLWRTININTSSAIIETADYFYNETKLFSIEHVKDCTQSALLEEYYSNIIAGSFMDGDILSFPATEYLSFKEEKYGVQGTCNIDRSLRLKCDKFITDTNIIEDVLINDNDEYDDELFLIQYTSTNSKATKTDIDGISGYIYNNEMLNGTVVGRYTLVGSTFTIINNLEDKFRASYVSTDGDDFSPGDELFTVLPVTLTAPDPSFYTALMIFNDDSTSPNFDNNNRFNNATNVYTANNAGNYSFEISFTFNTEIESINPYITEPTLSYVKSYLIIDRSVGGTFTVDEFSEGILNGWFYGDNDLYHTAVYKWTTYLNAGETMTVDKFFFYHSNAENIPLNTNLSYLYPITNSYLKCTSATSAVFGDAKTFKSSIFKFDQKLTADQVKLLLNNPGHSFTFTELDDVEKKVWVNDITIQLKDNFATIEAISDLQNTQ